MAADPLIDLERALREVERNAARRITDGVADQLQGVVAQRFRDGRAPVRSGALRDSVKVKAVGAGEVEVQSDKEYARFYEDRILPDEAEVERVVSQVGVVTIKANFPGVK